MFWDKIKNKEKRSTQTTMPWNDFVNLDWNSSYSNAPLTDIELKESTYYKCINRISSDVSKVPLQLKQTTDKGEIVVKNNPLAKLIDRPNPYMSQIDFLKCMEAVRQHKGESGALIQRDAYGNPIALYPIEITRFIIDNAGIAKSKMENPVLVYYRCGIDGMEYNCLYSEILHFKGLSFDGLRSTSVKANLSDTITTNQTAQAYQKDLFSNGLTNKAVVQLTSDIKEEGELKKIQAKFARIYSNDKRIFTVPAGFNISPLNLNLADSQFAELKKMSQVDICTSFGLQPWQIGIWDGVNNNSMEQSNLSYLNDVLLILFEGNEAEFNYKLLKPQDYQNGYYFSSDEQTLLRMDNKTQAEVITNYVKNGVYSLEFARRKLGVPLDFENETVTLPSGQVLLSDLKAGKASWQNNNNKNGGDNSEQ
ncbi:hypothetical protein AGR56_09080 [Clostridium sp. DMHC 10]|uniref:phage portal protein n=1 Tax=Clostridium sp. DMHC 10 TaxID=747377 RepID=UPI00069DF619|nr:phage portal protein [Clostridium sp. DMHC 10]KOF56807.1 hypothetical protein AGR56_09080 [Clostridium sp. DMHC 10]